MKRELVRGPPRIGYPAAGSRFAWDPDIAPDRQRIVFEMQGDSDGLKWWLDGKTLGAAQQPMPWEPKTGHHELKIVAADGKSVDTVAFEVRGGELGESAEGVNFE
jgi:penicillin-binding protein 1C